MDGNASEGTLVLAQMASEMVRREFLPLERELTVTGQVPHSVSKTLKELGYYGLAISEEYGGVGLSLFDLCLVSIELAKAPLPFVHDLILDHFVGCRAIERSGSALQKQRLLPGLACGQQQAAMALTEQLFVANRSPDVVIAALRQEAAVCAAILTEGWEPESTVQILSGLPMVELQVKLNECKVSPDNLLSAEGAAAALLQGALQERQVLLSAMAAGIAQRLLELSLAYAQSRVQFGAPIGQNQAVQIMLADMAMEAQAAGAMVLQVSGRLDRGEATPSEIALLKVFATEMVGRLADKAVQIHGGMGYMRELPVERIYREVRHMRFAAGSSEQLRLAVARSLLGGMESTA